MSDFVSVDEAIDTDDIICIGLSTRNKRCTRKRKFGSLCKKHYLQQKECHIECKIEEDIYCIDITLKGTRCKRKKLIGERCKMHHELIEKNVHCHDGQCKNEICINKTCQNEQCLDKEIKLCVEKIKTRNNCPYKATKGDLCTLHYNLKIQKEKEIDEYLNLKDGLCIDSGKEGRCLRKAKIGNLCTYHHNLKLKKEGKFIEQIDPMLEEKDTKICASPSHKSYGSKYIREKVPLSEFQKKEGDFEDLYESCTECREYGKNMGRKRKEKLFRLNDGREISETKACQSLFHDILGVSSFPRLEVPISLFRYKSKNAKELSHSCLNCREYRDEKLKKYADKSIVKAS